jgi:hypothetical protein
LDGSIGGAAAGGKFDCGVEGDTQAMGIDNIINRRKEARVGMVGNFPVLIFVL